MTQCPQKSISAITESPREAHCRILDDSDHVGEYGIDSDVSEDLSDDEDMY